jgi:hypothetical protein
LLSDVATAADAELPRCRGDENPKRGLAKQRPIRYFFHTKKPVRYFLHDAPSGASLGRELLAKPLRIFPRSRSQMFEFGFHGAAARWFDSAIV